MPNEYVLALRTPASDEPASLPQGLRARRLANLFTAPTRSADFIQLVHIRTPLSPGKVSAVLKGRPEVAWFQPNFAYEGQLKDEAPSRRAPDPMLSQQLHHDVMDNPEAWAVQAGRPEVVVAITDDGVATDHEDLAASIWTNPKEIAGNNVDDDGNGFVDDVHGWDFTDADADARPKAGDDHGTHVAGIVAAQRDNGLGVSGTAPGVKVMPIRWTGGRNGWTSALIAKSFAYAVDNGARIVTTSYRIDQFVNDPVVTAAMDYMDSKGALYFNSAGNDNKNNSDRTKLRVPILVGSSIADNKTNDKKSSFSNYGTGVDIFAPGGGGALGILSTLPGNKYGRASGTSMASPNAAAASGLVWSAHPEWSREQVLAQVLGTADDITAQNAGFERKLGTGRVNTRRALTEKVRPPRLDAYKDGTNLVVRFPNVLDPAAANQAGAFSLKNVATGAAVTVPAVNYRLNSNELRIPLTGLAAGTYELTASAAILKDPFGQPLDGDGDGTGGDDLKFQVNV